MPENSWRHHYIPKFYLTNFTNELNKFYIYLVKEERYKGSGKLFSPESHFFEEDGNTIITDNSTTDFLEIDFYKQLDNDIARLFHKIKTSPEERYGLTEKDMPILQFFVAHLFWRNPMNDEFVKNLLQREGLNGLGLKIRSTETNEVIYNSETEKKLVKNETTYKIIKYWLPSVLFKNLFTNEDPLTILRFNPGNKPALVSDNPLILRNPKNFDVYRDEFILPLSNDKVLIRTKKVKAQYQNTTRVLIDSLLVRQANKFISSTEMNYIPLLKTLNKTSTIEELRNKIFISLAD